VAGADRAGGMVPGAAGLHLAAGVALLRPEEQVLEAMLAGWGSQQMARNLSFGTAANRQRAVRAFAAHADAFPWQWSAQLLDEWCTGLRAVRHLARSAVRNYTEAVRLFCGYLTDPAYGWAGECQRRFGTHPVQVCHEWNTAVHVQQGESGPSRRAFTVDELEMFFDYAGGHVEAIRAAGRKGWWPAFRDATLFKVAYAFGLRRNEARMLDVADFGRNLGARMKRL
jgi:integrase/recombinase XerC